jgi:hypothetical protein
MISHDSGVKLSALLVKFAEERELWPNPRHCQLSGKDFFLFILMNYLPSNNKLYSKYSIDTSSRSRNSSRDGQLSRVGVSTKLATTVIYYAQNIFRTPVSLF